MASGTVSHRPAPEEAVPIRTVALSKIYRSPHELKANYGAETVITVTVDGDGRTLAAEAGTLGNVRRAEADGSTVRVFANPPDGVLAALVERAAAVGLPVRDASSQPPSLETV